MHLYRLNELAELAHQLGWSTRRVDERRLEVLLPGGSCLAFQNSAEGDVSIVGFADTGWHDHGIVMFGTGASSYVEYDELDILGALGYGEIVIVSRYRDGTLMDRMLCHRLQPLDLAHMELREEFRVLCVGPVRPKVQTD